MSLTNLASGIATPNLSDINDFAKAPRQHIETKYPNAKANDILFLIFSSLFLFVWEIIVLCTVPGAIAFIAIGQVWSALLAISDHLHVYTGWQFYFWLGLDVIL